MHRMCTHTKGPRHDVQTHFQYTMLSMWLNRCYHHSVTRCPPSPPISSRYSRRRSRCS